jgi:predicted Rossmann-fold nucleotide-binding protein
MGEIARTVSDGNGKIQSVIPKQLMSFCGKNHGALVVVPDMHTRKRIMSESVILPLN